MSLALGEDREVPWGNRTAARQGRGGSPSGLRLRRRMGQTGGTHTDPLPRPTARPLTSPRAVRCPLLLPCAAPACSQDPIHKPGAGGLSGRPGSPWGHFCHSQSLPRVDRGLLFPSFSGPIRSVASEIGQVFPLTQPKRAAQTEAMVSCPQALGLSRPVRPLAPGGARSVPTSLPAAS